MWAAAPPAPVGPRLSARLHSGPTPDRSFGDTLVTESHAQLVGRGEAWQCYSIPTRWFWRWFLQSLGFLGSTPAAALAHNQLMAYILAGLVLYSELQERGRRPARSPDPVGEAPATVGASSWRPEVTSDWAG